MTTPFVTGVAETRADIAVRINDTDAMVSLTMLTEALSVEEQGNR